MKEKIEKINFNELSVEDTNNLLNELLTHEGDDFKELVLTIIDTMEYTSTDETPTSIDIIFSNERVKSLIDEILLESEKEV